MVFDYLFNAFFDEIFVYIAAGVGQNIVKKDSHIVLNINKDIKSSEELKTFFIDNADDIRDYFTEYRLISYFGSKVVNYLPDSKTIVLKINTVADYEKLLKLVFSFKYKINRSRKRNIIVFDSWMRAVLSDQYTSFAARVSKDLYAIEKRDEKRRLLVYKASDKIGFLSYSLTIGQINELLDKYNMIAYSSIIADEPLKQQDIFVLVDDEDEQKCDGMRKIIESYGVEGVSVKLDDVLTLYGAFFTHTSYVRYAIPLHYINEPIREIIKKNFYFEGNDEPDYFMFISNKVETIEYNSDEKFFYCKPIEAKDSQKGITCDLHVDAAQIMWQATNKFSISLSIGDVLQASQFGVDNNIYRLASCKDIRNVFYGNNNLFDLKKNNKNINLHVAPYTIIKEITNIGITKESYDTGRILNSNAAPVDWILYYLENNSYIFKLKKYFGIFGRFENEKGELLSAPSGLTLNPYTIRQGAMMRLLQAAALRSRKDIFVSFNIKNVQIFAGLNYKSILYAEYSLNKDMISCDDYKGKNMLYCGSNLHSMAYAVELRARFKNLNIGINSGIADEIVFHKLNIDTTYWFNYKYGFEISVVVQQILNRNNFSTSSNSINTTIKLPYNIKLHFGMLSVFPMISALSNTEANFIALPITNVEGINFYNVTDSNYMKRNGIESYRGMLQSTRLNPYISSEVGFAISKIIRFGIFELNIIGIVSLISKNVDSKPKLDIKADAGFSLSAKIMDIGILNCKSMYIKICASIFRKPLSIISIVFD